MSMNKFVRNPDQLIAEGKLTKPPVVFYKKLLKVIIHLNHRYYGAPKLGW